VYKKNKKFKHAQGILDQRFKICLYATTPYAVPTLRELVVENVGKNIQHWISLETTVTRIIQVLYNAYLQKIHWIF